MRIRYMPLPFDKRPIGLSNLLLRSVLCLFVVLFAVTAEAQITVKGTVLDDTNLPLAGTNVLLKDATGVGTVTDFDGNFTIEVPGIASPATSHVYKKKRLS